MPEIDVIVNGRPYKLVCDAGEEDHLRELAGFLDKEVQEIKSQFGQIGDSRLLVMASLVIADKLSDAVKRIERSQSEIDGLKDARTAALERARAIEQDAATRLDEAAGRLEALNAGLASPAK